MTEIDPYDKSLIGSQIEQPEQPEQTISQPQQKNVDYVKILTDAALRHPKEVNHFLDTVIGKPGKALLISGIKQSNPQYALIIDRIFPVNGNNADETDDTDLVPSSFDPHRHTRNLENEEESLDDDVWDEAMEYANERLNKGDRYATISDRLWSKYQIDLSSAQVKSYLMRYNDDMPARPENITGRTISKGLDESTKSKIKTILDQNKAYIEEIKKLKEITRPRIGLIRKFFSWLW
jgi:hypothetical protein